MHFNSLKTSQAKPQLCVIKFITYSCSQLLWQQSHCMHFNLGSCCSCCDLVHSFWGRSSFAYPPLLSLPCLLVSSPVSPQQPFLLQLLLFCASSPVSSHLPPLLPPLLFCLIFCCLSPFAFSACLFYCPFIFCLTLLPPLMHLYLFPVFVSPCCLLVWLFLASSAMPSSSLLPFLLTA